MSLKEANLLMTSLHEKNLIIMKKVPTESTFLQVDVVELRENDLVFFRHPENLRVLVSESGNRIFKLVSNPFPKNGIYILDLEEVEEDKLQKSDIEIPRFTSDTLVGKCYLRLV